MIGMIYALYRICIGGVNALKVRSHMYKNLKITRDSNIVVITLSRVKSLNSLNRELLSELNEAIDVTAANDFNKGLIITGEGGNFAAGADINEQKDFSIKEAELWSKSGALIFRKLELLDIPTIAAVDGYALGGGCELALSCDMIFASKNAKFGQPEVKLGVIPGFSGTVRLSRRIGASKALELILSGEIISANEAKSIGLVNRVFDDKELMQRTISFLNKTAEYGPTAIKNAKIAIRYGSEMNISEAIRYENQLFSLCYANGEGNEGMHAFIEKREPEF